MTVLPASLHNSVPSHQGPKCHEKKKEKKKKTQGFVALENLWLERREEAVQSQEALQSDCQASVPCPQMSSHIWADT